MLHVRNYFHANYSSYCRLFHEFWRGTWNATDPKSRITHTFPIFLLPFGEGNSGRGGGLARGRLAAVQMRLDKNLATRAKNHVSPHFSICYFSMRWIKLSPLFLFCCQVKQVGISTPLLTFSLAASQENTAFTVKKIILTSRPFPIFQMN